MLQQEINEQYEIVGREDPEYPPDIEILQTDGTILLFFRYEQGSDQEAADHEKYVYTKVSVKETKKRRCMKCAKSTCCTEVVNNDYENADGSQTIQARYIVFHLWIGY